MGNDYYKVIILLLPRSHNLKGWADNEELTESPRKSYHSLKTSLSCRRKAALSPISVAIMGCSSPRTHFYF